MSEKNQHRADLVALVGYLVLAVLLTYPLILHFATHVAGDGSDDPALAWNLWWVPYAILNLSRSPIYTDYMFYPIGVNLAFYTLTYLNAFLSIPVQFAFNLIVSANVNLLLSFTLSGFGTFLLVKWLLREERGEMGDESLVAWAAFAAGAVYAFSSNKLLYASLGQFNIASSHWIPFYVLFLLKLFPVSNSKTPNPNLKSPNLQHGLLLGLFLVFQALSEFIFASFLIIFTALYLVYWLVKRRGTIERGPLLGLAVAVVVFTVLMSPILAAMIQDMRIEGDYIQSGVGFADTFSSDLLGFFVPSPLHPWFRGLNSQLQFAYTNFAYLGFIALALAMLALWKIPFARRWGLFGAFFALISLGPGVRVNGQFFDLPMPFDLLLEIPFIKGNRYPSRWSVMVTLALAVLVGYGVLWISQKLERENREISRHLPPAPRSSRGARAVPGIPRKEFALLLPFSFLLLTLLEHLSLPLPLSNFQVPAVYETIAQDRGDFTVLEIPLAWRNGFRMMGTMDQAMMFAQWYQTQHRHPILGGNTSRNPELKFQYFTEAPVINSLIAVETGHTLDAATIQRDRELAGQVLRFFGVRYVVWHSPRSADNRAALEAARAYVEQVLPVAKFYDQTDETGQTVAYRVSEDAPEFSASLRVHDPLARLYFAEGWGALPNSDASSVWATRNEATLLVPRDGPSNSETKLTLELFSPTPDQTVRVSVNGQPAGNLSLRRNWYEYTITVPGAFWRAGINRVTLEFAQLTPVAAVPYGPYEIHYTGLRAPASIVVRSAGSEVGDFGHIFVNGVDVSPNQRGYNVAVIDVQSGRVETSAAFDTFGSENESRRLAQFIREISPGKIVAVAARDEVSRHLTPDAVDALRSIGAAQSMSGKWRWSHAILGVKGAPPGTALESASVVMPAQLSVGIGAMEPNVAAAIDSARIDK